MDPITVISDVYNSSTNTTTIVFDDTVAIGSVSMQHSGDYPNEYQASAH